MRRILITGGSGFVGSHFLDWPDRPEGALRVLDNRPLSFAPPEGTCEVFRGDLGSLDAVVAAAETCDGIIHLAGVSRVKDAQEDPRRCVEANVTGTVNVLEAARLSDRRPWIVMASSEEVVTTETGAYGFTNLYGISKAAAELIARRYAEDYGLRVLALRFSGIYGSARDKANKVPNIFVLQALGNHDIRVNDPVSPFDFVHYTDALAAISRAVAYLDAGKGEPFHGVPICSGLSITLDKLVERIVRETGSTSSVEVSHRRPPDVLPIHNNPETARTLLGFQCEVSLSDGLRRLADELRRTLEQGAGPGS